MKDTIPNRTPPSTDTLPDYMRQAGTAKQSKASEAVRVLLVGEIGTGKTCLIGTAPLPLVIDLDEGTRTIADKDIPIIRIPYSVDRKENRQNHWKVYDYIIGILIDARTARGPFAPDGPYASVKTIALDGYTALAQKLLNEVQINAGQDPIADKPQYDEWGELLKRLISITEEIKKVPQNVIATANTMLDKDEATGRYFGFPSIIGSFRTVIGRFFDEVYYLEAKPRKRGDDYEVSYRCYTKPTQYFAAKSRTDLPTIVENITFDDIAEAWETRKEN